MSFISRLQRRLRTRKALIMLFNNVLLRCWKPQRWEVWQSDRQETINMYQACIRNTILRVMGGNPSSKVGGGGSHCFSRTRLERVNEQRLRHFFFLQFFPQTRDRGILIHHQNLSEKQSKSSFSFETTNRGGGGGYFRISAMLRAHVYYTKVAFYRLKGMTSYEYISCKVVSTWSRVVDSSCLAGRW